MFNMKATAAGTRKWVWRRSAVHGVDWLLAHPAKHEMKWLIGVRSAALGVGAAVFEGPAFRRNQTVLVHNSCR